jgi:hypothetical protein
MNQPDRRQRKAPVGQQRQMQREGEDVRVGRRQVIAQGKAADLLVGGQATAVDGDVTADQGQIGDLTRSSGHEGQPRRAGDHRGAGARKQAEGARRAAQLALGHG